MANMFFVSSESTHPYGRWRCRWTRHDRHRWRLRICSSQCRACRRQRCVVCYHGWTIQCGTFGRQLDLSPPRRALRFCTSGSGSVPGRPTPRTSVWHFHHSHESCCSMISTSGECLYWQKNNNVWITKSLNIYLFEYGGKKKIWPKVVSWTWIHVCQRRVFPQRPRVIFLSKRFDCLISR